jgi:hypothetical protein
MNVDKNQVANPVAWLDRKNLDNLKDVNGMSLWAENPAIHYPNISGADQAPADLVAVYLEPQERALTNQWQPIKTMLLDSRKTFLVQAFNVLPAKCKIPYTSDPYVVFWLNNKFQRWPHDFPPTHWMAIPSLHTTD